MRRLNRWLLRVLARGLEPAERDVVLGDVMESGEGAVAAMRDVLGLIVRRQVGLWKVWQPWVALFGIGCLVGVPLSQIVFRLNVGLGQQLKTYFKWGVHYGTGLTVQQDIAFLLCLTIALLVWSWTCGFVLGSLSGRTVWFTWAVFYILVLDSATARFAFCPAILSCVIRDLCDS